MDLRTTLLSLAATPDRAWLVLLTGILLVTREFAAPGRILPGVLGAIAIFTAGNALREYQLSPAGLTAVAAAFALTTLQAFRRWMWLPGAAAAGFLAAGARGLTSPPWQISWPVAITGVPVILILTVLGRWAVRGYRNKTTW